MDYYNVSKQTCVFRAPVRVVLCTIANRMKTLLIKLPLVFIPYLQVLDKNKYCKTITIKIFSKVSLDIVSLRKLLSDKSNIEIAEISYPLKGSSLKTGISWPFIQIGNFPEQTSFTADISILKCCCCCKQLASCSWHMQKSIIV